MSELEPLHPIRNTLVAVGIGLLAVWGCTEYAEDKVDQVKVDWNINELNQP